MSRIEWRDGGERGRLSKVTHSHTNNLKHNNSFGPLKWHLIYIVIIISLLPHPRASLSRSHSNWRLSFEIHKVKTKTSNFISHFSFYRIRIRLPWSGLNRIKHIRILWFKTHLMFLIKKNLRAEISAFLNHPWISIEFNRWRRVNSFQKINQSKWVSRRNNNEESLASRVMTQFSFKFLWLFLFCLSLLYWIKWTQLEWKWPDNSNF